MSTTTTCLGIVLVWAVHSVEPSKKTIQLDHVHVPLHPQVNQSVSLMCEYNLHGEPLYSIKWYKDQQEFYRYLPKESPPSLSFSVPGTTVDVTLSDSRLVHLRNISLESAGLYQCEVSTEAPKFKTIARDERMSVVHPPSSSPTIVWVNQRQRLREIVGDLWGLRVGERVVINCLSDHSFPAANLKFYINDEIASDKTVKTVQVPQHKGVLISSKKSLDIILERRHFRYGNLVVKCTSDIYDIYFQSSKITFAGLELGEMALGRQAINSGFDQASFGQSSVVLLLMVIVGHFCLVQSGV